MRGVDEGNERRTTYTEKEEGGRERERERERGDDRANVPVRACCSGRSAPSPNAGSLPLLLMIIKLVCVWCN
jgi:hypothetical protein